jgi:hypothetical protein
VFYIGIDANGLRHLINAAYYSDYKIEKGHRVLCHLDRINCLGRFFFEPEHPCYLKGGEYLFKLNELKRVCPRDSGYLYTAIVQDLFGNIWETCKFIMKTMPPENPDELLCRVIRIRKARLLLEVVDPLVM